MILGGKVMVQKVASGLADLPQQEGFLDENLRSEIDEWHEAMKEQGGLLPQAACPALLGVSRQRFQKLVERYDFWCGTFFGNKFYSYKQLHAFSKVERKAGRPGHSAAKVLSSLLKSSE